MNKILIFGLIAIVVLPIVLSFSADARLKAYGIEMSIDSTTYNEGDTITITSQINYPPPVTAHFDIYNPSNVLVYSGIDIMSIEEPFDYTLIAGTDTLGIKWVTGNYTINEWYSESLENNATALFQYTAASPPDLQEQITALSELVASLQAQIISVTPTYYTVNGDLIHLRASHEMEFVKVSCNTGDTALSGYWNISYVEVIEDSNSVHIVESYIVDNNTAWHFTLKLDHVDLAIFEANVLCVSYP